jgi:PhnB protein
MPTTMNTPLPAPDPEHGGRGDGVVAVEARPHLPGRRHARRIVTYPAGGRKARRRRTMPHYALPDGHHTVNPSMVVTGAARLISFLETAFGGTVVDRYDMPGDLVAHAEVKIGDAVVFLGDPQGSFQPMPCMLSLYVDDVDASYQRALDAGAESVEAPENQFYGHRTARVKDPSGNVWSLGAIVEDLSREEIERRVAQMGQT